MPRLPADPSHISSTTRPTATSIAIPVPRVAPPPTSHTASWPGEVVGGESPGHVRGWDQGPVTPRLLPPFPASGTGRGISDTRVYGRPGTPLRLGSVVSTGGDSTSGWEPLPGWDTALPSGSDRPQSGPAGSGLFARSAPPGMRRYSCPPLAGSPDGAVGHSMPVSAPAGRSPAGSENTSVKQALQTQPHRLPSVRSLSR